MSYTCPRCGQTASCWSPNIYKQILPPGDFEPLHDLQLQNIREMLATVGLQTVLEAVEEIKRLRKGGNDTGEKG